MASEAAGELFEGQGVLLLGAVMVEVVQLQGVLGADLEGKPDKGTILTGDGDVGNAATLLWFSSLQESGWPLA